MQPAGVPHAVPILQAAPPPPNGLQEWLRSPHGQGLLSELRWLLPSKDIVINRIKAIFSRLEA